MFTVIFATVIFQLLLVVTHSCHAFHAEMVRDLLAHIPATIKSEPPILSGGRPFLPDLGAEADLTPLHLAAHEGNEGVVRILLNIPGVQADGTSRLNVRLAYIHVTHFLHSARGSGLWLFSVTSLCSNN